MCNGGINDQALYEFLFTFNGEATDFLNQLPQNIARDQCYDEIVNEVADRCLKGEYIAAPVEWVVVAVMIIVYILTQSECMPKEQYCNFLLTYVYR